MKYQHKYKTPSIADLSLLLDNILEDLKDIDQARAKLIIPTQNHQTLEYPIDVITR